MNNQKDSGRTEEEVRQGNERGSNRADSFRTFESEQTPTSARSRAESDLFTRCSAQELSFARLRDANVSRCKRWHQSERGLNEWSLSDWFTATMGELGEAANIAKKLNRERDGITGNSVSEELLRMQLADELADTLIYLDILAASEGIDLAAAVVAKFNRTSEKVGFPERL